MMINDENKKSIAKMFKSKSFYIALGVCLLAAGAAGISALNMKTPETLPEFTTEKTTYMNVNDPVFHDKIPEITKNEPVLEPATNAPAAPVTEKATEPEPSTAAVFDNNSPSLETTAPQKSEPVSFSLPINGALGKDYSMGAPVFSSTMGDYRTHNGIDITGEAGQQVKTAAPGKVTAVYSDSVWGNTVETDHGQGYVSRICGLADEALISAGMSVAAGEVIGVIGTVPVEAKDASHIHFEIRRNGELCDPLEVLGFTETDD